MIGKRVMVIHSRSDYSSGPTPYPPIGACGAVESQVDEFGELDVVFDNYPCPTPGDPSWITHISMIVFIEDEMSRNSSRKEEVLV